MKTTRCSFGPWDGSYIYHAVIFEAFKSYPVYTHILRPACDDDEKWVQEDKEDDLRSVWNCANHDYIEILQNRKA